MNAIALVLIAAAVGSMGCSVLTSNTGRAVAPRDAFDAIVRGLRKLAETTEFVRVKDSRYRFWPKGQQGGVSYDGKICTYVSLVPASLSFSVTTYVWIDSSWKELERSSLSALEFARQLQQGTSGPSGIPASVRSEILDSYIHRRVFCGIPLGSGTASEP